MRVQLGLAERDRLEERGHGAVALAAPRVLLRVEALVRDLERDVRLGRLVGEHHGTERALDPEALTVLGECLARPVDQLLGLILADRRDEAELVAAEAICGTVPSGNGSQLRAKTGQEGVSGGMAEGVVVGLESVEIEDHQEGGLDLRAREAMFEIVEELPTVPEARERICRRLVARELEQPPVLPDRHSQSHADEEQHRRGQHDRQEVDRPEVVVDEDGGRRQRAGSRDGEQWTTFDLELAARRSRVHAACAMSSIEAGQRMSIQEPWT